jgi:hypothetical protein
MADWERSSCCGGEQEQTLAADHGIDLLACDRGEEAVRQAGGLHEITRLDYDAHCGVDRAGIASIFSFPNLQYPVSASTAAMWSVLPSQRSRSGKGLPGSPFQNNATGTRARPSGDSHHLRLAIERFEVV